MSNTSMWLVLAGMVLIAELASGTFYLLMVSLGALVGALFSTMGFSLEVQVLLASVVAVVCTLLLIQVRKSKLMGQEDHVVQLDVGNRVHVQAWVEGNRTHLQYRGATWSAESQDASPQLGLHEIVGVEGSLLKVKHISTRE